MLLSHVFIEGFTLTRTRVTSLAGRKSNVLCGGPPLAARNQLGAAVVGMHITTRQVDG